MKITSETAMLGCMALGLIYQGCEIYTLKIRVFTLENLPADQFDNDKKSTSNIFTCAEGSCTSSENYFVFPKGIIIGSKNLDCDYGESIFSVDFSATNCPSGNGSVSSGLHNNAISDHSSVTGGGNNVASGFSSSVSGGRFHEARADYSSVSGGYYNEAGGIYSSISGGSFNAAHSKVSSINGGKFNIVKGDGASISGGYDNSAEGSASAVSGGKENRVKGAYSSVDGGFRKINRKYAVASSENNSTEKRIKSPILY